MSGNQNLNTRRRFIEYNSNLNKYAKELRKNMTEEERKLWYLYLNKNEYKFVRQKIINNYILDFYCSKLRLGIEIDGSQHYHKDGMIYDIERTNILNEYGIKIIRYTNKEINEKFYIVCEDINNKVKELTLQPNGHLPSKER